LSSNWHAVHHCQLAVRAIWYSSLTRLQHCHVAVTETCYCYSVLLFAMHAHKEAGIFEELLIYFSANHLPMA